MMKFKRSSSSRLFWVLGSVLFLVFVSLPVVGQQAATITYTQDFPGSDPSHYMISISSDGRGHYEGNGKLILVSDYASDGSVPDAEQLEFTPSATFITKVFDLAKRAKYFQGEVENKKRNLAFTGKKILTYNDGKLNTSATFNYASVPEVLELTRVFQNLSSTLEFGRRLAYCHRHQKLALDAESKQMESTAKSGGLEDIGTIAPIMQKIIDDR